MLVGLRVGAIVHLDRTWLIRIKRVCSTRRFERGWTEISLEVVVARLC